MKSISSLLASLVLVASPALAQAPAQQDKPMCEEMADKECEHKCCKKDDDGKMVCKMMDHSKMDHSKMDHSKMDHSKMDHSKKDGAETSTHSHD